MTTYRVIRFYFRDGIKPCIIKKGLSREEAQAHCHDPETSSSTCSDAENLAHTDKWGPWFDGWEDEATQRTFQSYTV